MWDFEFQKILQYIQKGEFSSVWIRILESEMDIELLMIKYSAVNIIIWENICIGEGKLGTTRIRLQKDLENRNNLAQYFHQLFV